LEADLQHLGT